jgi:hypothetical protein
MYEEKQTPYISNGKFYQQSYFYIDHNKIGAPIKGGIKEISKEQALPLMPNVTYPINLKHFLLSLSREDRDNLGFYVTNENPALKYILEDGKLTISEIDSIIEDFESDSGTKINPETAELAINRLNYIKSLIS